MILFLSYADSICGEQLFELDHEQRCQPNIRVWTNKGGYKIDGETS